MVRNELRLRREYEFDAAHFLPHHEGLCKNIHGHRYKVEIEISGSRQSAGPESGMLMDFGTLDKIMKPIIARLDHTSLNARFSNPTAENMVMELFFEIQEQLPKRVALKKLTLWETPRSCAIVEAKEEIEG